jgi:hypothetical protein
MTQFEDDDEALEGYDDLEEMLEHAMDCSLGPDGQCGKAGSEYCDFECRAYESWIA